MQNSLFVLDPQKKSLALLHQASMATEGFQEPRDLESWLSSLGPDTRMFGRKILWVSRQDRTTDEQRSDLIGIADDGDLVVAELKRGQPTDHAITQALSYAAVYSSKTPDELAAIFLTHSAKVSENRSLIGTVATMEEAQSKISGLIGNQSDEPIPVNGAQTVLLVAEDFTPSALKTCDYLNQALTSGGLLIIECWRYRLYKDAAGKYLFAIEKVLPVLELSDEIESSREKARESKWLRDPIRLGFVGSLKDYLNSLDGIKATRKRGQSYEFDVRLTGWPEGSSVTVYAHNEGPPRLILSDPSGMPPALPQNTKASTHWNGASTIELLNMDAKSLSFSAEIGGSIVDILRSLAFEPPRQNEPSGPSISTAT
jgi:hypothetical protein